MVSDALFFILARGKLIFIGNGRQRLNKTNETIMNAYELTTAIEARLQRLNSHSEPDEASKTCNRSQWRGPLALAIGGVACAATAACLPAAAPHLLPALAAATGGGGAGALAGLNIGGLGVVLAGTAFGIPAAAVAATLGVGGATLLGGGTWLGQLLFSGPALLATPLCILGIGQIVLALLWGGWLLWQQYRWCPVSLAV